MIRVMVVDDERNALEMMGILLSQINEIEVVGKFTKPQEALDFAKCNNLDAIFLDIDMPKMNGLNLAKEIKNYHHEIQIIFITAHRDFAVEAFEINSVDYVLKPVIKKRLVESVNRLKLKCKKAFVKPYIKCFTAFESLDKKGKAIRWRTAKVKELWAYLVLSSGQLLDRDKIIEDIWGNVAYSKGKTYLHTCLSYLRKDLVALSYSKDRIIKEYNGYRLDTQGIECDYYQFNTILLAESSEDEINTEYIEKAINLYGTGLLKNEGYVWAQNIIYNTEKQYIKALESVIFNYEQQLYLSKVVDYLEKLIGASPYSDYYCRKLMNVYIERKERPKAISLFIKFKNQLKQDLNISPELLTEQLYDSLKG